MPVKEELYMCFMISGVGITSLRCIKMNSPIYSLRTLLTKTDLREGKDCDHFEYECANTGSPLASPQCIAIYDRCDGIVQCADNSDELACRACY